MNHGHVTPNPDGSKARCGGPSICPQCAKEAANVFLKTTILDGLNVWEYERLVADSERLRNATNAVLYAGSRRPSSGGVGWVEGPPKGGWPEGELEKAERMARAAWATLITSYTTPGCVCDFCSHESTIMCRQRWNLLSLEERQHINESIEEY